MLNASESRTNDESASVFFNFDDGGLREDCLYRPLGIIGEEGRILADFHPFEPGETDEKRLRSFRRRVGVGDGVAVVMVIEIR